MDMKQQAAREAVNFIQSNTAVGLGAGATMAYMAAYLSEKKEELNLRLYTSSNATRLLLQQYGFTVNDISSVGQLHIYFDGCDQFDTSLNALKSGGGIHTMEKLLASMADEFILVGDESKYAEYLETKYPVVVEVLPQSVCFVLSRVQELFSNSKIIIRRDSATNNIILTENSNMLLDIWFEEMPALSSLNPLLKTITGVIETSLFYGMANKVVIAGSNGIRIMMK